MRWPLTIVVLSLVLAISLGLYRLESQVQQLERRLFVATAQLQDNRRNSRILAAEWSFLSQPSRLQALARRHLALGPLEPDQIGGLAALPLKTGIRPDAGEALKPGNEQRRLAAPPVPGWKPAKPGRAERIILASSGRQP
ncbi:MAG: hypothetical protein QGF20_06065 [Alphaproteobacteria bacterium]|jgi:hypothetical protein|nr:hypothetical protein [Alphaproteobacteria bacterium]